MRIAVEEEQNYSGKRRETICFESGAWDLKTEDPEAGTITLLNLSTRAWKETLQIAFDEKLGKQGEEVSNTSAE